MGDDDKEIINEKNIFFEYKVYIIGGILLLIIILIIYYLSKYINKSIEKRKIPDRPIDYYSQPPTQNDEIVDYMEVKINKDPPLSIKIKRTPLVKEDNKLSVILTNIIKIMCNNLKLNAKKKLSDTKIYNSDNYIVVYHCDPELRLNHKNIKYNYVTNLEPYQHLKKIQINDDLKGGFDNTFGLGVNYSNPVTSICDQDLLCNISNRNYKDENIFVHEFSHTIMDIGLRGGDVENYNKIIDIYNNKYRRSLENCDEIYACLTANEMWAEATQVWFNVTKRKDVNKNIDTIDNIKKNLPELYDVLMSVYGEPVNICGGVLNHCHPLC